MINDLDIVQWEYLLSPEFELINSAGKPLTGGWIEVYLHGTRDKYYCASDFDGTLHPFQIPLDSIGANVVLADPNNAYDVYVYNKFGSLIMSRYNVKCQGSGGSSTYVGDKLYYGQYRANNVTTIANLRRNKGNINITDDGYLKLKSGMSYHITVRGSFTVDDPANEDTTLNYIEYTSVNPIKIDIDETKEGPQYFELSYDIYRLQEDIDYQVAFAQSNGLVKDLIVEVHSLSNLATSATGGDQEYEAGWGIDITNNVVSVDPSIFEDYTYTAGDYISIDGDNVISVTGINPEDFATHDEVHEATVTAIEFVSGMIPSSQMQSDWDQNDSTQPDYIKNKPTIPSIEGLTTVEQVSAVSGYLQNEIDNIPGQVQSDWTEDDNTDPAYIKNKPEEYNLVAGDNITIDVSGTNIVISSEGGIASGASGCNVEFVNIYDYRGQITDREPGAQTTYTGGIALANAMRDIMRRGHMPLLVYGAPAQITEVFTPVWIDTREFARGTNGGYSCVPLTGHEFFSKNPVTSFVTTKIVIDALNDKISDFIVSADTVATVGRGLTVDYFGAGDPWVWYEGYGPTPPASVATTPGLCRIEIASSIPDVTQVQTMIDTSIASLPITGLPTTELGKFTIQNNVSGGPIEVICPTDQGHPIETVILDNTAVSGTSGSGTASVYIVYKSPGYDDDYYSTEGSAILHIPEAVTGLYSLQLMYAPNSNPTQSGPSFTTPPYIYGDSTRDRYVLDAGDYDVNVIANHVSQSPGGYGKYITLQAVGPAPDVQALLKSSFSLVVRHPELGITVNLDKYYLGNTNTITNTSGYPQAYVYIDPATKKQSVYMSNSMPSNWTANGNIAQRFEYGTNGNSPSNSNYGTKLYKAYKYTSSPNRYQFAYLTDWDEANKVMTFIAYDNSGNAIEKWTLDYTTYSSNIWTTTPISAGSTYTAGEHISIENDEIAVTGITELVPGDGITITTSGASAIINSIAQDDNIFWAIYGTTTYDEVKAAHTAGKKIVMYDSDGNVVGLTQHDGTDGGTERFYFCWVQKVWQPGGPTLKYAYICKRDGWYRSYTDIQADWNVTNNYYPGYIKNKPSIPNYTGASGIDITNDTISLDNPVGLVAGNNITIEVSGVSAIISSTGGGGGSSYTAGTGIDITNNEISVDNTVALKTDIPTVPSAGNMLSITNDTIDVTTTAGITDIQLVNALPASPVSSVLYLIPET